ncbi:DUF3152 domain-containing protein [Actinacidiphila acidipaludis]|uniref:DUF3152 domain-containing protein n=1 Tax=Actinacidiphila acidipaludis TaxID=2873382 RepID=A0ABS7Q696_9ACTN|nr:DUF3152 domain-containing protein [Streptomyces acidipaludis]MBY8877532.1 DUF3152 domain-containing protein [Streptomyces acidipaludis]
MGGARGRSAKRGGRRGARRSGGGSYVVLGLIFLALLGVTLYVVKAGGHAGAAEARNGPPGPGDGTVPATAGASDAASGASSSAKPHRTTPGSPAAPTTPDVPGHGTGDFSTADAAGKAVGQGTIRRYKVEVEGGTGISAAAAAHEIQGILADPRGWTDDGRDGFQLVSSGPADFVIKIATPDTVDAICGAAGLHTHGEVNCDVGPTVVVNLKRWQLGSPQFPGPIHGYRALIINHEVGHRIGHGHEGCPGPGRLAPVMMQQIDGLHGCRANAWPYDASGHYIQGPSVP